IGAAMDIVGRLAGALVSFVLVAVLMLRSSATLGLLAVGGGALRSAARRPATLALLVGVGVPLLSAAVGPLLRPLHRRRARHRELVGTLTTVGADTVSGLRVLGGIGGEGGVSGRHGPA